MILTSIDCTGLTKLTTKDYVGLTKAMTKLTTNTNDHKLNDHKHKLRLFQVTTKIQWPQIEVGVTSWLQVGWLEVDWAYHFN
jgi:hypothetical protein